MAIMNYISNNVKTQNGQDRIEIITAMVNAIFSKNANLKNTSAFRISNSRWLNMEPISTSEEFGYSQIKEAHIKSILDIKNSIFTFDSDKETYSINYAEFDGVIDNFKVVMWIDNELEMLVKEVDEQLTSLFNEDDYFDGFIKHHPWRNHSEAARRHEIKNELKALKENKQHSNDDDLIKSYIATKKRELETMIVDSKRESAQSEPIQLLGEAALTTSSSLGVPPTPDEMGPIDWTPQVDKNIFYEFLHKLNGFCCSFDR
ncbi:hypothetical protein L3V82_12455 [Thiotrichales bacterium 19S3-7]|nr:hypothetical protein [Thiotrichales bacterium 19S3-7]MCF6803002.1 hypothetical protein [Thiotrichales bacterium 19S3-11]